MTTELNFVYDDEPPQILQVKLPEKNIGGNIPFRPPICEILNKRVNIRHSKNISKLAGCGTR